MGGNSDRVVDRLNELGVAYYWTHRPPCIPELVWQFGEAHYRLAEACDGAMELWVRYAPKTGDEVIGVMEATSGGGQMLKLNSDGMARDIVSSFQRPAWVVRREPVDVAAMRKRMEELEEENRRLKDELRDKGDEGRQRRAVSGGGPVQHMSDT